MIRSKQHAQDRLRAIVSRAEQSVKYQDRYETVCALVLEAGRTLHIIERYEAAERLGIDLGTVVDATVAARLTH